MFRSLRRRFVHGFERVFLGAVMGMIAFLLERRLLKALQKRH
jgi:hypothetical protein